jgi:small neutral amino acid transporter SnatA (MarC family)
LNALRASIEQELSGRVLVPRGALDVITKMMGLILAVIGMQMLIEGLTRIIRES